MANIGLNSASLGVFNCQLALDVIGNNIANIDTNGFKSSRTSFADLMYSERNTNDQVHIGHGSRIEKTDLMFEQSQLIDTGRMLDFAVLDEGLFAVETKLGETMYTKDGAFSITQTSDGVWELTDGNQGFVLDYEGNHIEVPFIENTSTIDYETLADMLGVYTFENPYGLDPVGTYYQANASSGPATVDTEIVKRQGYIEGSSTNIANEMAKVVEFQRAYQLNITMVKTNDELQDIVNNLRG